MSDIKLNDLPRLDDEDRAALDDNYSVMPVAMDDEQIARRDAAMVPVEPVLRFLPGPLDGDLNDEIPERIYMSLRAQYSAERYDFDQFGGWVRPNVAALIKAAPDLLKALKGVVRVADRATDEFDAARAAIAKAEGRQP